jgi:mRNA interferase YafQ
MYSIAYTGAFKKDYKRCSKRNYNLQLLQYAVELLETSGTLPESYKLHKLSGDFKDCWECHLLSDWLIIWMKMILQKNLPLSVPVLIPICFKIKGCGVFQFRRFTFLYVMV